MNHRGISCNKSPVRPGALMTVPWHHRRPHRNLHWQLMFCVTTILGFPWLASPFKLLKPLSRVLLCCDVEHVMCITLEEFNSSIRQQYA